jgi:MFS family permease
MLHTDAESGATCANHEPAGTANRRRGVFWILVAFGLLAAGLVGGTLMFLWRPDWVWPFPVAGFVGYVLAFRSGMLLWNPNIDRTWRRYFWLDRDTAFEDSQPVNGRSDSSEGAANLRLIRPEPPHPSQHELRVVR